jgi:UDP-glucose 4-epimerase
MASTDDLFVVDDLSFGRRELAQVPDDRFFRVDMRRRADMESALARIRPQYAVHLGAVHFIPYCDAHPLDAVSINIGGTRTLFELLQSSSELRHVVFASTAAVYPPVSGPLAETIPAGPIDIYGYTKLVGEDLCEVFSARTKVMTTACRLFNVFGPDETNPHFIPEIQRQLLGGARRLALGNLSTRRDYVHTTDVARAIGGLLTRRGPQFDVFNVGTGRAYSGKEVLDAFSAAIGEPIEVALDERRLRPVDRPELIADSRKLQGAIGWRPAVDLRNGIAQLMRTPAPVLNVVG